MSDPASVGATPRPQDNSALPFGLHVASILCGVVGLMSIAGAFALGIPALQHSRLAVVSFGANLVAASSVCAAGILLRRQSRAAAWLLGVTWLLPILVALALGSRLRFGGFLLLLATLTVAVHWRYLR
jgi:hypothetical protein